MTAEERRPGHTWGAVSLDRLMPFDLPKLVSEVTVSYGIEENPEWAEKTLLEVPEESADVT